jgi:hypothetical protein
MFELFINFYTLDSFLCSPFVHFKKTPSSRLFIIGLFGVGFVLQSYLTTQRGEADKACVKKEHEVMLRACLLGVSTVAS